MNLTIGECHKCSEQVKECTQWDITELGFICAICNKEKSQSQRTYIENAAWLKEHNRQVSKQLNT